VERALAVWTPDSAGLVGRVSGVRMNQGHRFVGAATVGISRLRVEKAGPGFRSSGFFLLLLIRRSGFFLLLLIRRPFFFLLLMWCYRFNLENIPINFSFISSVILRNQRIIYKL
jgi:hypothetical protein